MFDKKGIKRYNFDMNRLKMILLLAAASITLYSAETKQTGTELVEIDKFDKAIKDFSDSIEKGTNKTTVEKFLKLLKTKPNREIIAKISRLSGLRSAYPLAYSKLYDWNLVFSSDGTKILYQGWQKGKAEDSNSIFVMNIDGKNQKQLVDSKFKNASPDFSPDNKSIIFQRWSEDTNGDGKIDSRDNTSICVVDIETKEIREVAAPKYRNLEPDFSPDNKYVIYQSIRSDNNQDGKIDSKDNREVFIIEIQTGLETRISGTLNAFKPVFSPDSAKIAFHAPLRDTNGDGSIDYNDNKALFLFTLKDSKIIQLVSDNTDNTLGAFSPLSNLLVFNGRGKVNRGIYITGLQGKPAKKIVNDDFDSEFASFSPDGKRIAFYSYRSDSNKDGRKNYIDNRSILMLDTIGYEDETQVTGDRFDNEFISFYPDGKKVIFQSFRSDTNGDGLLDISDNPSLYIVGLLSTPNLKVTTLIRNNGSIARIVEITTDPLFKGISKEQEKTIDTRKWKTEYIKDGQYHFKAMTEYKNRKEFENGNKPSNILVKQGVFINTYSYREIFQKKDFSEDESNAFLALTREISKVTTKKTVIQSKLTVPGEILDTNAVQTKGSTVVWIFSAENILKSNKDYEMYVSFTLINWLNIAVAAILLLGAGGYLILSAIIKAKKNKFKELELSSDTADAHNYMGQAFKNRGMYTEAVKEFKKALDAKPDLGTIHLNLAEAFIELKEERNAVLHLKKAIAFDPALEAKAAENIKLKKLL